MKQKLTLLTIVFFLAIEVVAQNHKKSGIAPAQKKPSLFGIAFNLTDFNALKNSNIPGTLGLKNKGAGVSLYYWKGLAPFIDFSTRLNGIFYNYSALYSGTPGKTEIGIELEPTINIRPVKDENIFAPFLTAGAGVGLYSNHPGAYVPLGAGIQLNASSVTYFFLQAQYKWSITPKVLGNNLFYAVGFAQNIGSKKSKTMLPAVPAAPVAKDTDNDGIPDEADACPDVKGIASLKGCPDADGDGITDKDDKCPDVKGLLKYNGCPIPDTDKDGINDEEDKCPEAAGLARYQGCPVPDTDKDGINDEEDKCPAVPGVAANMGCPEINVVTVQKINKAAQNIFFATGSSKLLPKSTAALNGVAVILKANADYKVEVDGYTDNKGDAAKNRVLSETRANAVVAYLINKGIDAKRLTAAGFGDENPVADNAAAAGRAKNRRVEMKVQNY